MLGYLRRRFKCGSSPSWARAPGLIPLPASFQSTCKQPQRPHPHRHIAPTSGGTERPEHHAEPGRDLLRRGPIHRLRMSTPGASPILGQCNMYNNASYRRFNVSGTTSFAFSRGGSHGADDRRPSMPGLERPSIRSSPRRESMAVRSSPTRSRIHLLAFGIMSTRFITRISIARFNPSVCLWAAESR